MTVILMAWLLACSQQSLPTDADPVGAELIVEPQSAVIGVGGNVQLQASPVMLDGEPLPGYAISWLSSDPSVATVSDSGLVTAVAVGAATITASAQRQGEATTGSAAGPQELRGNAAITVVLDQPPPPPDTTRLPGAVAELPRVFLDTSYPTLSGDTIRVAQGGDLQAAIDAATPGDLILLESGAEFVGPFTLREKSGSGWIVIQSDSPLPPQGTRIQLSDTAWMAQISAPAGVSASAIQTADRAHSYRLVGLYVTSQGGASMRTVIVDFGGGATVADMPYDLTIDRSVVRGHPAESLRRCILLNARRLAVVDSHVDECHAAGFDSQAILSYRSPGPLKIVNNFLAGAAENVMFGGADPGIPGLIPEDIEVRYNHFFKPLSWHGSWSAKNLFESKFSRRVLVEGNVFENAYPDAQIGFAILLKAPGGSGNPSWAVTEDWTFRYNKFRNVNHGIEVVFQQGTRRIDIHDNVFEVEVGIVGGLGNGGRVFETVGNVEDLRIVHNTAFATTTYDNGYTFLVASKSDRLSNLVFSDNIIDRANWGIKGSGLSEGRGTLDTAAPGHLTERNVFIGADCSIYPGSNFCPLDRDAVGFVGWQSGDYHLMPTSQYRGVATDGRDPGADIDAVEAHTAGAAR